MVSSNPSSSRSPPPTSPTSLTPSEACQLPRLERLDSETTAQLGQRLVKKKKSFFRSNPTHHAHTSSGKSPSPIPSQPVASTSTLPSREEQPHPASDEDVPWDAEEATHAPPPHRSHTNGGIHVGIRHRGKLLIRNPEPASDKPKATPKARHQSRKERKGRQGSVNVQMGVSEFDSERTAGEGSGVWRSESGVRARVGRAGARVRRGVGGSGDGETEDGSLRQVDTRTSTVSGVSSTQTQKEHSHNPLRGLTGLLPHRRSSTTEGQHDATGMPTPPPSKLVQASSEADGSLATATHAPGEDPSLPPSSAPLGLGGAGRVGAPPQLERLDSGEQLQTSSLFAIPSGSQTPPSPTMANASGALPSPPQTPAKSTKRPQRPDVDTQPSSSSFLPPSDDNPEGNEFLSPLPRTSVDEGESLPWGREAEAQLNAESSDSNSNPTPTPVEGGVQKAEVLNWTDYKEELEQEEEQVRDEEEYVDEPRGRQKLGQGEVVWERLFENQRGILWFGTPRYSSSSLLPTDPMGFTRPGKTKEACRTPYDLNSYQLPDGTWSWASPWMINMRQDGETDEKGWEYNAYFRTSGWHAVLPWHGWKGWVRRREWIRLRIHPPPPKLSSLSPPPSPSAAAPLPLPVTDAPTTKTPRPPRRDGLSLDACVKDLAAQMLDRERIEIWSGWLEDPQLSPSVKRLCESDFPTLLNTFTHPSSRHTLTSLIHDMFPDWELQPEGQTVADPRESKLKTEEREGYVVPAGASGEGVELERGRKA